MNNKTKLQHRIKSIIREIRTPLSEAPQLDDIVEQMVQFAENDYKLGLSDTGVLTKVYVPALLKFKNKGTFDRSRAIDLLVYYWTNYVRPAYKKLNGEDVKLNPNQRKQFAEYFLSTLEDEEYI